MTNIAIRAFSAGELSPAFYARTDTGAYARGLRTCRNAVVMRTGGVENRAGTQYLGSTKADGAARIIPCVFSDARNYLLEFGDGYVRFWQDGERLQAVPIGAWAVTTAYLAGNAVTNGGETYYCYLAHTSAAADEPGVGANWEDYWTLCEDGQIEIPTPYQDTDLAQLRVATLPDQLVIVHPDYAVRVLTQTAVNNQAWNIATATFTTSSQAPPTSLTASVGGTGGFIYAVTAVDAEGNESTLSNTDETNNTATAFANCTLNWTAATGAVKYNIYRTTFGTFGLLGSTTLTTFLDDQPLGGSLTGPPQAAVDFSTANNYPSAVATHQQRLILGATNLNPDKMWASVTGQPFNFTTRDRIVDSDMVAWRQVSKRAVAVRHLLDIGERLVSFATVGEFVIRGNDAGVLVPDSINPVQLSYNGISDLEPLAVDDTALYVQARGNQVRNLVPVNQDGYSGTELSWTANHLLDGYALDAWAYQEVPHSTAWMVRDDGTMLSLTYFREAGVVGWARHDTDGSYESVAVVAEGSQDAVYAIVNRTINSVTKRYVERFYDRTATDCVFMDCVITQHAVTGTLTIASVGGDLSENVWVYTATASVATFSPSDVGRVLRVRVSGTWYTTLIVSYTSSTQVGLWTSLANSGLAGVAASGDWFLPPDLRPLATKAVSVVVDGVVTASPNNPAYAPLTAAAVTLGTVTPVTGYTITLSDADAEVLVGLPFTTDLQTLDIDAVGQTIKQQGLNVGELLAWVEDTEKFWAGPKPPTTTGVTELEQVTMRDDEGYPLDAGETLTGVCRQVLKASWNNTGRVFLRNVDPTPMTILAIIPTGYWGGR